MLPPFQKIVFHSFLFPIEINMFYGIIKFFLSKFINIYVAQLIFLSKMKLFDMILLLLCLLFRSHYLFKRTE